MTRLRGWKVSEWPLGSANVKPLCCPPSWVGPATSVALHRNVSWSINIPNTPSHSHTYLHYGHLCCQQQLWASCKLRQRHRRQCCSCCLLLEVAEWWSDVAELAVRSFKPNWPSAHADGPCAALPTWFDANVWGRICSETNGNEAFILVYCMR